MSGLVISLCDRTGHMVRPWVEHGYTAETYDLQVGVNPEVTRSHHVGNVLDVDTCAIAAKQPVAVFAFPPCTDLAGSGARWYRDKGLGRLIDALRVVEACRAICEASGALWMLENPVGVLSKFWRAPDHAFHPVHYRGYAPEPERDDYTKKTHLWTGGGFVMPDRRPGEPTLGSMMWRLPPTPDRADLRSATPLGFAYAVFEANRLDRARRAA